MKYRNYILLTFSVFLLLGACKSDDLITDQYDTINETRNDPLNSILVNTPVISFVAGEPNYTIDFIAISPSKDIANVNVYKTFTDATSGGVSDEVLLGTYAIDQNENTTQITDQITYDDLREGVTVNGGGLPDSELDLAIGSKWDLRLEPVNGSGEEVTSAPGISVAVLSPFAGLYTVIESAYYRIGVESGLSDFTGQTRFIGSVDENTFAHVDAWGPFLPGDGAEGQFVFDVNPDNSITILDDPSQLFFSGDDMLTCQEDAASFVSVPCAGSNVLEPKDDGKHIIKLTYGYFTASGDENEGAREFYEVLEKIN